MLDFSRSNSKTLLQVVNTLPTEPTWAGKRVNYGKDRCAYVPKSQQVAAQQAQAAAAQSLVAQQAAAVLTPQQASFSPFTPYAAAAVGAGAGGMANPFTTGSVDMMTANNLAAAAAANGMANMQSLNRTVYLGNIHPETTPEDLCNAIRGGVLQSIRYLQDKHIAVCFYFSGFFFHF